MEGKPDAADTTVDAALPFDHLLIKKPLRSRFGQNFEPSLKAGEQK